MPKRNWKNVRPTSFRHAIELCKDFAKDVHNKSVEKIGDDMGLADHWQVYKWIQNGRIPGILIRPFENACGCTFITDYNGASAHKLLIDIPKGRKATAMEVTELQAALAEATSTLINFYADKASADETQAKLTGVMAGLAYHRANVAKLATPELDLFSEGAAND